MFQLIPITSIGSANLYASPKPDGQCLPEAIEHLQAHDIDTVVCLLQTPEMNALGLSTLAVQCAHRHIEYVHLPIPDFGIPRLTDLSHTVDHLHHRLCRGRNVLVHCRGGIGRTGTLCCALLIANGALPTEAIDEVSLKRGCPVPETPAQRNIINDYYQWVCANKVSCSHQTHKPNRDN